MHSLPLISLFIEESQAGIKISPQDSSYYGQNDRKFMNRSDGAIARGAWTCECREPKAEGNAE
ncbi:hypothetical protein MtrunA17_Chr6g0465201 [Medicago truncatula]|uniref:Uncharacterized protein n=1 Tax=Medicago truncatula TaxID=3880 RepID=A0A396HEX7_MEDTR|nr:hypothetical protein MtrunA17_Chr6g0465201 [Medicago truncatula]